MRNGEELVVERERLLGQRLRLGQIAAFERQPRSHAQRVRLAGRKLAVLLGVDRRLFELVARRQRQRHLAVGGGQLAVELQGFLEVVDRAVEVAAVAPQPAAPQHRARLAGHDLYQLVPRLARIGDAAFVLSAQRVHQQPLRRGRALGQLAGALQLRLGQLGRRHRREQRVRDCQRLVLGQRFAALAARHLVPPAVGGVGAGPGRHLRRFAGRR